MARFKLAVAATTAFTLMAASGAQAEEGMWTFDNFPAAKVNETYTHLTLDLKLTRLRPGPTSPMRWVKDSSGKLQGGVIGIQPLAGLQIADAPRQPQRPSEALT